MNIKSKVEISQNFVAFSEYLYFKYLASLQTFDFSIPTPKVLTNCITKVVKEIEQIKSGKFDVRKKIKLVNTAYICSNTVM